MSEAGDLKASKKSDLHLRHLNIIPFTTFESKSHSGQTGRIGKHLRPHSWRWLLPCFNPNSCQLYLFEDGGNSHVSIQTYVNFIFSKVVGMIKASSLANLNFGWRKETSVWTKFNRSSKELKGIQRRPPFEHSSNRAQRSSNEVQRRKELKGQQHNKVKQRVTTKMGKVDRERNHEMN